MKEFWIVCKWDKYYPQGGLRNIVLVTTDYEEALRVRDSWESKENWSDDYDCCGIFHSEDLPWGAK